MFWQQLGKVMRRYRISGVPVTQGLKLVGILTNRDLRFETRTDIPISAVMTKKNLITVPVGTTLEEAEQILHEHRVEKLLVVNDEYELKGLITVKDIQKKLKYPNASKDEKGRLRVGGAIGATGDFLERAAELVKARIDVLAIDSAHGHSSRVLEAVREVKKRFPGVGLVAGNVATYEGALALIDAGADAIKVGIGPGSICTTRMVTGAGMPQITAIAEAYRAARERDIPVIADGGIKYSGEVTKAIAAGASSVMIGSLFAGVDESPGETILYQGRSFKSYRGMGSLSAMSQGGGERYFQSTADLAEAKQGAKAWFSANAMARIAWPSMFPRALKAGCRIAGRSNRWSTSWWAACARAWVTWGAAPSVSFRITGSSCAFPAPVSGRATCTTSSSPVRRPTTMWNDRRHWVFWVRTWLPVALGIAMIAVESTEFMGADHTSGPFRALFEAIFGHISDRRWEMIHHYIRKSGHFVGYGLIGLAWLRAWWMTLPHSRFLPDAMLALLGTALIASADEYHQSFLPNRTSSPWDVLLDCTGAITLQLLVYVFMRVRRPKRLARAA